MTANRFGAFWTEDKLRVLGKYLGFFTNALKKQGFSLVYIDAFAGTGRCSIKRHDGERVVIDGSAKIALDCVPAFDAYRFIEKKKVHQEELAALISSHPNGSRAQVGKGAASDVLPSILQPIDWRRSRGVLFLDPFGLQVTWELLEQIAATKALDVFFLVSLSGLYRQAARRESSIDEGKARILTRFLGTDGWRDAIYSPSPQGDMFIEASETPRYREPGWEAILKFTTKRLRSLFPYVGEPNLLAMANGAPLFALYFAVSNPEPKALGLASRVSKDILSTLPRYED